jgi:hypothetical protein
MGKVSRALAAATAIQGGSRHSRTVIHSTFIPPPSACKNTYGVAGENALLTLAGFFFNTEDPSIHTLSTAHETSWRLLI